MNSTNSGSKATLEIGNTIAEMEKVVDFVDRFGVAHNIPQFITNDMNLCLEELLNNTISYGYEDTKAHSIMVSLLLIDGLLIAEVQDDGKPFDPSEFAFQALDGTLQSRKLGGLGLRFVKTLTDEMGYTRLGQYNVVKIMKKLPEGRGDGDQ